MTMMVSKSKFKPKSLEYFREVEMTGQALIITDHGKPVLKIVPYKFDPSETLSLLRASVLKYESPTEPVGAEEWEASK